MMADEEFCEQEIEREAKLCTCRIPLHVGQLNKNLYMFGEKVVEVRYENNTVVVRSFDGSRKTLHEFLCDEDPCRVSISTTTASRSFVSTMLPKIKKLEATSIDDGNGEWEATDEAYDQIENTSTLPIAGMVSGKGLREKLVYSTAYEACEDCGWKLDRSCACGVSESRKDKMPSEIMNDPRLLSLYTKALKTGQNKDCSLRVNVVGNFKQGKTTLVRRMVEKDIDTVESTNGIDVDTYICKRNVSGKIQRKTGITKKESRPVVVTFWDFGGQYIFYATHTLFHSSRAIYILVFDLSTDLGTVVKDEEYPDDTRADRNMEYFARFWMNSIHSFVGSGDGTEPPVILVGTHMDKLHGSQEEKRREADRYFERIRRLFDGTQITYHILPTDFAIDNTDPSDTETKRLRDEIFRIGNTRTDTFDIPARWIPLEENLKKKQHLKIVPFETVVGIDKLNPFPLKEEMQIKLFLQYHHAKGTLVYFDEDPLSNYVVLDVQYLIDAFKCIITSERFCSKDACIRPLWRKLTTEARLEMDLIDKLWGNDTSNNFLEHKTVLLAYLKKHHIISEVLEYDEDTGESKGMGWFVVPSLLTCHTNQEDLKTFLEGKTQTAVRLVITFGCSSVVHTVYHRILAAALGRWPVAHISCKSLLYENLGVFLLREDHAGIAEINGENIDLRVVSLCVSERIDNTVADQFRRFADSFIEHEFRKLREHVSDSEKRKIELTDMDTIPEFKRLTIKTKENNKPQISAYRCNHEKHGLSGSFKSESLTKWKDKQSVPCPDHLNHKICIEMARFEWFQQDGVTGNIPDKKLNEKHLSKMAQAIGRNWEVLGFKLGLTLVQIDHIAEDNRSVVMKIFAMLRQWQCQMDESATMSALVEAVQRCKSVRVDWDKIRNLIDELE